MCFEEKVRQEEEEQREANDDLEQLGIKFSTAQLGKLLILPFSHILTHM